MNYVGAYECVDIAATNAGIRMTQWQIQELSRALVDMGADFNMVECDACIGDAGCASDCPNNN